VFSRAEKYRFALIFLVQNSIQKTEARSLAIGAVFSNKNATLILCLFGVYSADYKLAGDPCRFFPADA